MFSAPRTTSYFSPKQGFPLRSLNNDSHVAFESILVQCDPPKMLVDDVTADGFSTPAMNPLRCTWPFLVPTSEGQTRKMIPAVTFFLQLKWYQEFRSMGQNTNNPLIYKNTNLETMVERGICTHDWDHLGGV